MNKIYEEPEVVTIDRYRLFGRKGDKGEDLIWENEGKREEIIHDL